MAVSDVFARGVALVGGTMILLRRRGASPDEPAVGPAPSIPPARAQGIPTLKMPTARGWRAGQTPVAAPGLAVNAFATGIKHPRWIEVLPNGDVLVAQALQEPGPRQDRVRLCHRQHHAARGGARHQPEPDHPAARRRR